MDVRHSEVKDFLRCRKRWDWRWNQGLKPKKQNNKLFFGTLMHKYLETYYSTGSHRNGIYAVQDLIEETDLSRMDELEYKEIVELLNTVIENYNNRYAENDSLVEVIATELTFKIPLDEEISYTGTIDLIVRDKRDNKVYFMDHKTTSSVDSFDKNSDMDTQISRYWWALQQLQQGNGYILDSVTEDVGTGGEWVKALEFDFEGEIGGFIYNIILKDYPRPPKVLKDGSLSKAKNQNTTFELYMKSVNDIASKTGEPRAIWEDYYSDILDHLEQNPREYFRRINVIRTQSEIDASIQELYHIAKEETSIREENERLLKLSHGMRGSAWIHRNITKDCVWDCPFVEICKASLDGSNVDFLIEELFTKEEM